MYDTIHFWLPVYAINESHFEERIDSLLSNTTLHSKEDGQQYITGSLCNMNAVISVGGMSLKGSLCKSYLSNNFKTLTRQDVQRAIEMLADTLALPIQQAYIKRIDFAQNFTVSYLPETYYAYLGDCSHFKRLTQPKSIYYQNAIKAKLFYDKIAEAKTKAETIPVIWANKHVLRYETRYTKRLPKQFNKTEIQAKDLYAEAFYMDMVGRYVKEYEAINKLHSINFNLENMKKPKDFFNQLLLLKLNEIGQPALMATVEELRVKEVFEHPEYYSRVKSEIKRLFQSNEFTLPSDLITELSKKIGQVKEYCR